LRICYLALGFVFLGLLSTFRMAVDIYDSQYLLILAPSLVIALMFLFFWLFMKETSYDEVLAKQKRDLKLPPSKPDPRKKNEKKKSKKKESSSGGSGGGTGGGGESEEDLRDFDVAEGANSSTVEVEEEPVSAATPDPALPTPTPYVPVSVSPEAPTGLRERKKKEKKAAKAAAAAAAAASATAAITVSPSEEPEVNGSKPVSCKTEAPLAASKQSSTPSPKREVQVQIQAVQAPVQAQTPPQISGKKKEKKKQKVESADEQHTEVKVEQAPATVKKEAPIVAETKVLDGATQSVTSGKKKNSAKKQKTDHVDEAHILPDSAASANHQTAHNDDAPSKGSGKKQKNETDKENTEVKLKELLSGLSSLALSDAEAVSVMALLREKSPNAVDAWHKSSTRPDPTAQEREKLLTTLQEEASIAKDKVKQLSQELQVEKQKTNRVESMMREQRAAMEKELGSMQVKAQGTYQELQTMQIKFQQVREQLEGQISRLQQENSILRDAVSSATNQMESKNSAELNKLRSEYAGLMKELSDSNSKLQQEEHQRKSLEVSYKQNVSQLEDAKRRWEELQNFIHSVNAEREKIQTSKQELHNQLLAVEAEMSNKNKEIQTLHSSLTEAVVSKDRLEQKVRELMEMSKHSMQDDSLQARVQVCSQLAATHVSHIEELQKLLAEKELQRKSLEDSLNAERSSGASRETNMQALHNENMSLKAEIQNLQAQISDQVSCVALLYCLRKKNPLYVGVGFLFVCLRGCFSFKTIYFWMSSCRLHPSWLWTSSRRGGLSEKEKQVSILQAELAELRNTVNLQRKKNDENQTALAVCQAECRDVLHRLLPHVPLPSEQNHQEWLQRFERAAGENSAPQSSPGSGDSEELAEKLKEAEETQRVLQKDCETYKKVLAETEGILQRLQNSVEQEESRWRVKLELSQAEQREMSQKVAALEQEVERLTDEAELENLRREKQHLESELERAERESATYVTEVRELKDLLTELQTRLDGSYTEAIRQNEELTLLKTQLTETLSKLEAEENERQKVAGDLYKAQQSVDLIQGELSKVTDNADDLIENSSLSSQREEIDRNEKMTAGLGQTVSELQQLLQTVSRQLTKRQEGVRPFDRALCYSQLGIILLSFLLPMKIKLCN
uniref:Ribosome receptor lysine/proline rich domain-containing protein n=1 Tax=Astatotilapia calliptera TaxID=8154 RepID=A0AAX7UXV8_ASTCA